MDTGRLKKRRRIGPFGYLRRPRTFRAKPIEVKAVGWRVGERGSKVSQAVAFHFDRLARLGLSVEAGTRSSIECMEAHVGAIGRPHHEIPCPVGAASGTHRNGRRFLAPGALGLTIRAHSIGRTGIARCSGFASLPKGFVSPLLQARELGFGRQPIIQVLAVVGAAFYVYLICAIPDFLKSRVPMWVLKFFGVWHFVSLTQAFTEATSIIAGSQERRVWGIRTEGGIQLTL